MTVPYEIISMGMDVELFLEDSNKNIIGSEKFINDKGIDVPNGYGSKIVKDGIQCEINPHPGTCRANIGNEVKRCFIRLSEFLKENKINANFNGNIEVTEDEFKTLSEESKKFGCEPDFSIYNEKKANIKVNGAETRQRTAGGHIHIGMDYDTLIINGNTYQIQTLCKYLYKDKKITPHDFDRNSKEKDLIIYLLKEVYKENIIDEKNLSKTIKYYWGNRSKIIRKPEILIPLMDLIVGIPSVLIDRDKNAKERRKLYGRAGDFRYQPHGIEYRTLSNFWIKSYHLMSLILGLTRLSFCIAASTNEKEHEEYNKLISLVDFKDVQEAINTNNYILAKNIFLKIEKILCSIGDQHPFDYPINTDTLNSFKQFILDGYEKYTNKDVIQGWLETPEGHVQGWEQFLKTIKPVKNIEQKFLDSNIEER
jgi:hypothetical protein